MTIGYIGKKNHISQLLESMFELKFYETCEEELGEHKLYLRNPKGLDATKTLKIPKNSILINLFKVGDTQVDQFNFDEESLHQNNYLVEYPGITTSFLVKKIESILLDFEFEIQANSQTFLDEACVSSISQKKEWLDYFTSKIRENSPVKDREFSKTMATIADELILNSFIHGYGLDPKNPSMEEIGAVKLKWQFDNINFSLEIEDECGRFNTSRFLAKQSVQKSADEIINNMTGGLGILMCINFCDHIEIQNKNNISTSTKVFTDLNRNLFSKMRRLRRASMMILNT